MFDEGVGPPVVLIHGLPGSAYDWRPLPEQLTAAGFRAIRYDRVGYGYSDRRLRDDDYRLDANADELLLLLDVLKIESPLVVGWSYGGGVALRAAENAPHRIRALLLIGSIGPERPEGGLRSLEKLLPLLEPLQRWVAATGFLARPGIHQMGRLVFSGDTPDWWGEHTLSMLALPGVVHTWTMETKNRDVSVLHPEAVAVPVHLLHGTADRLSPYRIAEDLQRRLPTSVLVRVEGGSHMLPNTHSALVVEAVRELAGDAG